METNERKENDELVMRKTGNFRGQWGQMPVQSKSAEVESQECVTERESLVFEIINEP